MTNQNPGQGGQQGGGSQKPGQQEQKPGQGGQQGGGGQQKPGQQQQEPGRQGGQQGGQQISVKCYNSVRSLSPGSAGGFFYWITMRDERRSSCKRLSIDAAFGSMKATVIRSR